MSIKGVIDGQPVNAATTNAAFLSKNGDDSTTHKVGLADVDPVSGSAIDNAQRELNAILSALGMSPNQIATFKLTWASNAVGAANDTVKARIEALVTLIQTKADASALATKADTSALTAHTGATTSVHGIADTAALVTKTGTQTLSGKTFSDAATFAQIATPANPSTGFNKIYAKADGKFYTLDSSGTETQVGSGAGGGTGGSATIYSYGPVSSTASQSTIGPLGFSVPVGSRGNFYLSIDGKEMSEGATNDYTWIDSANIQLNTTLVAGLNIKASYIASIPAGTVTTTATPANKNYITYGNFENNATTGWSLGTIGTLTNALPTGTPTFGSGAAGTLGISTVSSGKLAGTFSLQLASSAATVAGNCLASDAYAIDIADQAKVLSFKFNYKLASGTADFSGTKTNSFAVAVWDATNSAFIPVTGAFNLVQSSGVGVAQGTFQTNANTGSIRFIVYCANPTSGSVSLLLDEIYCGPQSLAFGPPMSDWTAFTPTWTGSTTNPAIGNGTITGLYRRVGDSAEVDIKVIPGSTTTFGSGSFFFGGLPGLSFDSTKLSSVSYQVLGVVASLNSGANAETGAVVWGSGSLVQAISMAAGTAFSPTVPHTWKNGDTISLRFTVPISGWSSNTVMSADSSTSVVALNANTPTGTLNVSLNDVAWTIVKDSAGSFNGTVYTVPSSGYYFVDASIRVDGTFAAGNDSETAIVVNGVVKYYGLDRAAGAQISMYPQVSAVVYCNAGDQIKTQCTSAGSGLTYGSGSTYSTLSIFKLSGPATVAASESVTCTVALASTYTPAVNTVIKYDTVLSDSHAKYSTSTGLYTCPSPGTYRVSVSADTSSTSTGVYLTQNGVGKVYLTSTQSANTVSSGSQSIKCNAGDTLGIFINANSPMVGASAPYVNCASFERIGN